MLQGIPLAVMWRILLILYTLLILSTGVYGSVFVAHSHWEYVIWFPPLSEIQTFGFWLDIIVNIALYIPFAIFFLQHRNSAEVSTFAILIMLALLLSCTVELYQVYSHNRRPSPLDIACNVTGALIGTRFWTIGRYRFRLFSDSKSSTIPIP